MKNQTSILMVALAISFVTALALAVALICVFFVREDGNSTDETERRPIQTTQVATLPPLPTLPPATTVVTEPPTTEKIDLGNGLLFSSFGNGSCVLVGLGSCTDACVVIPEFSPGGDRVVEIAARAFYGAPSITAIQIPAGVTRIGSLAFGDCKNLTYVSVNERNTVFCDRDGVLYSADGSTLYLYPAMRMGSSYTIRRDVREIREMAFYNCVYLKSISYTGTAEDWDEILIAMKNYSLTAASKTFAATHGK